MSSILIHNQCPVCRSTNILPVLTVKDYTVSQEDFTIWHCTDCTCRFTQAVPVVGEIGKYYQSAAYVSHSDIKKGLVNRLYHTVRNYTLQTKRRLVEKISRDKNPSLLDVGAGTGAFAAVMKKAGWQVKGLEPDATAKQNALKNHGLQLEDLDAIFTFETESFDVITLWHVLEHVHQLNDYMETFHRILKVNGALIIAVPNYTSYDADKYKEYWAAYDVPRHLYHFSPESIYKLMKEYGFVIEKYKPMWFDSFYVAMLSEQYKTGHNNLINAVWSGFRSNLKAMRDVKKCSSVIYIIKKAVH